MMISKLHCITVVGTILGATIAFAQGKQDIRGFRPGMTFAEAGEFVRKNNVSCVNFSREVIPYGVKCDDMTLWFSPELDDTPLIAIYTELRTNSSVEEVVKSISEQFSKPAVAVPEDRSTGPGYEWQLDGGKVLRFTPSRRGLHLVDAELADKADQERYRRSRVPVPKL
ncbi:hypothetical protein RPMA_07135 [Tardiphaga alba]|uniref:Uncharacterized protein n=1 Tax=Tardiphaga alba TaxID=340268 RepID=A0ABX8A4L9_9BRAD|nr:hypothetical protein [Tardiphaga alba]QUS38633.1 hypothetical protein RPMA_07135 [Tardiphaga alba]